MGWRTTASGFAEVSSGSEHTAPAGAHGCSTRQAQPAGGKPGQAAPAARGKVGGLSSAAAVTGPTATAPLAVASSTAKATRLPSVATRPSRPSVAPCAAAAAPQSTAQNQPAGGQRLRQAAAKARTEKLRSALQQLRSTRSPSAVAAEDPTQNAALQPAADAAADAKPHEKEQCPTAVLLSPVTAAAAPADGAHSDPEDAFDDISLAMLSRLRLGGVPLAAAANMHSAAHQALREVAADAEMLLPSPWQLQQAALRSSLQKQQQPLQQQQPECQEASPDLQTATAAMQQRLEQLRCALRSPGPGTKPHSCCSTPSAGSRAAAGSLDLPPQAVATAAVGEPRRQRLAASELIVTRAPSRPASAQEPAFNAAGFCNGGAPNYQAVRSSSSPAYSSAGGTAAARLAALLAEQPWQQAQPAALVNSQARVRPWQVATAGSFSIPFKQLQEGCGSTASYSPNSAGRWYAVREPHQLPPGAEAAPANCAAGTAAGNGGESDILEAWRQRRRQAGQLVERYSRYMSLQQHQHQYQPPAAASPPDVRRQPVCPERGPPHAYWTAGGSPKAPASGGMLALAMLPPPRPQSHCGAGGATAASSAGSSTQLADGGGDILERWRARRREQAAFLGGTADYAPLLTLRLPSSSSPGTAPRLPPRSSNKATPQQTAEAATLEPQSKQPVPDPSPNPSEPAAAADVCADLAAAQVPLLPELAPPSASCPSTAEHEVQLLPVETAELPELSISTSPNATHGQEEPQQQESAAEADAVLALVELSAAAAAGGSADQQPSRPPSAASNGRGTPGSSGLRDSLCSSGAWSLCTSQLDDLMDDVIGGLLFCDSCPTDAAEEAAGGRAAAPDLEAPEQGATSRPAQPQLDGQELEASPLHRAMAEGIS